jgi:transcriptional regulator
MMYVPQHFEESRVPQLHQLIDQNPLGVLITNGKSGLDANHIPFHLESKDGALGVLHSHVARANPVWKDITSGDEVLVVFRAAHAYISPNWYPSKHQFHKQVPTWNYMVAHAYGPIVIHDDRQYVGSVVARLTRTHESGQIKPWKIADGDPSFINQMLENIVGFEIPITRLVGKSKLSQNKDLRDLQNAGAILKARGEATLGDAMLAIAEEKAQS